VKPRRRGPWWTWAAASALCLPGCGYVVLSPPPMHPYYAAQLRNPSVYQPRAQGGAPARIVVRESVNRLILERNGKRYHYNLERVEEVP
jgi:hypothetical protein